MFARYGEMSEHARQVQYWREISPFHEHIVPVILAIAFVGIVIGLVMDCWSNR